MTTRRMAVTIRGKAGRVRAVSRSQGGKNEHTRLISDYWAKGQIEAV